MAEDLNIFDELGRKLQNGELNLPDESEWASKINGEEWTATIEGLRLPTPQEDLVMGFMLFEPEN